MAKQPWTKSELKSLEKLYKEGNSIAAIANELERSYDSVECRIRKLGVKADNPVQKLISQKVMQEETKRLQQLQAGEAKLKVLIDSVVGHISKIDPAKSVLPNLPTLKGTDPESLCVIMSDLHMGKKTPSYNSEIFKERLALMLRNILFLANIQRSAYKIDELVIFAVGDFVDGISIFPTHNWKVDEHVMGQIFKVGMPAMTEFLKELARHFKVVRFVGVRGNHGRTGKYNPEELNYDLMFYELLKAACVNLNNVKFEITWNWYQVADVRGKKFLCTHGDAIKMWLNIPIYGQTQKGMRWQGALPEAWEYLIMGHFHTIIRYYWNNFKVISNGTFVSGDDFAEQQLGMKSIAKQIMFGVHERQGVTWSYDLNLEPKLG